jgi:hypothetical protein
MNNFDKKKIKREIIIVLGLMAFLIFITFYSVQKIHQREDLALLQMDFTETIALAKICFDNKGVVQNPAQGTEGKVFICSKQDVVTETFPVLKKLSRRKLNYKYLSPEKCLTSNWVNFSQECVKQGEDGNEGGRINIGRGNKLVLSCNIAEGFCQVR